MTAYINRLLTVMVVCQIATVLAPDAETSKHSVRMVCALVSLLTLLSPLTQLFTATDQLTEKITAFFSTESVQTYDDRTTVSSQILQYVTSEYDLEELSLTIVTDETDTAVTELRFYIKNCPYATRAFIESELAETFDLPIYVFSE